MTYKKVEGKVVKAYRNMLGISESEFCRINGISLSTANKLTNGKINIGYNLIRKLARSMDMPTSKFVEMCEFFETIDDSILDLTIYNKLSEYYLERKCEENTTK